MENITRKVQAYFKHLRALSLRIINLNKTTLKYAKLCSKGRQKGRRQQQQPQLQKSARMDEQRTEI